MLKKILRAFTVVLAMSAFMALRESNIALPEEVASKIVIVINCPS